MKKLILLVLILTTCFIYGTTINGNVYLDNTSNHQGVTITFAPISSSAVFHQAISNTDGSFIATLENGTYNVIYENNGYQSYEIIDILIHDTTALNDVTLSSRPLVEVSGNVNGIWQSGNTYKVIGDITIQQDNTLTIEQDVEIKFEGYYSIIVNGSLLAEGTEDNYITFTSSNPTNSNWNRILFSNSTSSTSIMDYCIIEYAKEGNDFNLGMLEIRSSLNLTNSIFRNSEETAIYVLNDGVVNIANNKIYNCSYGIVATGDNSIVNISENEIYDMELIGMSIGFVSNESTVKCNIVRNCPYAGIQSWAEIIIEGNIISNNGNGLTIAAQQPNIQLNTFHSNNNGILLYESSFNPSPIINSNLFVFNDFSIYAQDNTIPNVVKYNAFYDNNEIGNNLPNGVGTIVTTNTNNTPSDSFYNIFNIDPDILSYDFTDVNFCVTSDSSPLLNAGDPNLSDNEVNIGSICYSSSVLSEDYFVINTISVYPNPTKDLIYIENVNLELNWVLFDALGNISLTSSEKNEKSTIDMTNLPNGIYFLKAILKDGNVVMKKIIKN